MTYEIEAETEIRYGYEHSPGNWTGLIGVLQDENSVSCFSAVIPLGRWLAATVSSYGDNSNF